MGARSNALVLPLSSFQDGRSNVPRAQAIVIRGRQRRRLEDCQGVSADAVRPDWVLQQDRVS